MSEQLIVILCGVLSLGGVLGVIGLLVTSKDRSAEERLDSLSGRGSSNTGTGTGSHRTGPKTNVTSEERTTERLVQAGLYRRNSVAFYLTTKFVLALVPLGIGVLTGIMGWVTLLQGCAIGAVLGLLGALLPTFWLDAKKRARQTHMRKALPDALDVIVTCVEAGMSLSAAIARVGRELQTAHPMLATEMTIVEREIQLGLSTGEAIKRFGQRFDLAELRSLASVILQAEKFGSSITRALRVHAEEMRRKRFQAAEERAQKASVKLLIPTILFIFPALYVVLLGPAVFDIMAFMQKLGAR